MPISQTRVEVRRRRAQLGHDVGTPSVSRSGQESQRWLKQPELREVNDDFAPKTSLGALVS